MRAGGTRGPRLHVARSLGRGQRLVEVAALDGVQTPGDLPVRKKRDRLRDGAGRSPILAGSHEPGHVRSRENVA